MSAAITMHPDGCANDIALPKGGLVLEMREIVKAFPGVLALDRMNLKVRPGTVHVLVGENGAGKSTLMKILSGAYSIDGGEILFKGEKLAGQDTSGALERGISMIHQELSPILDMTIAENIFLGREPMVAGKGLFSPLRRFSQDEHRYTVAACARRIEVRSRDADARPLHRVDAACRDRQGHFSRGVAGHHG